MVLTIGLSDLLGNQNTRLEFNFMITRFKLIVIALCLSMAGAAACSSSPEVPDQEPSEKNSYESTKDGEASKNASAEGDMAQPGGKPQAGGDNATIPKASGPIAHIDGEPVPAERFNTEIQKIAQSGQFPAQMLGQVKDQIIQKIVDKELIDRAVAGSDIDVSDDQLEERVKEIRSEFEQANNELAGQMGSLDALVDKLGITKEEFRESVRDSLAIEQLLVERGMEYPTDAEVKSFYEENKQAFDRPAQVQARHILIKVPAEADKKAWEEAQKRAVEIRKKATAEGADFGALAKEYSEGPSATKGGDLGWFGQGKMVPEFEEATFALEKGEVSEPLRTQFGWHVVKKIDEREAGKVSYEKVKPQLESKLRNQRVQQALEDLLGSLRTEKKIEMHPENVN
jgi:peptidyl-prolyl cis-trans isomerase C